MSFGLLNKTFREVWVLTLLCGLAAAIFEAIVAYVFWLYQEDLTEEIMEIEFIRNMIQALVGADFSKGVGTGALASLAWAHPVVLTALWAHEVTFCTRIPAAETDRGTIDVLFGLPLSRMRIYITETVAWMLAGLVVVGMAFMGNLIGGQLIPAEARPEIGRVLIVLVNMYLLYLAVGALALLASAMSDRRGRAVGVCIGVLLALFLWNFLGQFWQVARDYSYLSVLDYYKPMPIIAEGIIPTGDFAVLGACAAVLWVAGAVVFRRRDICTV